MKETRKAVRFPHTTVKPYNTARSTDIAVLLAISILLVPMAGRLVLDETNVVSEFYVKTQTNNKRLFAK